MRKRPSYLLVAAGLLGVYLLACVALLATRDFDDQGPLVGGEVRGRQPEPSRG